MRIICKFSYKFDYESDTIPDDQETVYKEISDIYNLELM